MFSFSFLLPSFHTSFITFMFIITLFSCYNNSLSTYCSNKRPAILFSFLFYHNSINGIYLSFCREWMEVHVLAIYIFFIFLYFYLFLKKLAFYSYRHLKVLKCYLSFKHAFYLFKKHIILSLHYINDSFQYKKFMSNRRNLNSHIIF